MPDTYFIIVIINYKKIRKNYGISDNILYLHSDMIVLDYHKILI